MKFIKTMVTVCGVLLVMPLTSNAWYSVNSTTTMDTHKMIAEQGLTILSNDLSISGDKSIIVNLNILSNNLSYLKNGSVWPDFNPDEYDLYQDHFYDPDTGQNYTNGYIPDTAESQTRLYFAAAIGKWKRGDYAGAAFDLGTAIHFFSDLNEPHHAANQTGGPGTAHTSFENWVDTVRTIYAISSTGNPIESSYYSSALTAYRYPSDFLSAQSYSCAKNAKNVVGKAQLTSTWADWQYAVNATLPQAQKSVAIIYYRFLVEVGRNVNTAGTDAIGQFHVMFKVANEYEAGTDDYVYLGFQLANGRQMEFYCNVPGNNFGQNMRWGYQFTISDATFKASDIRKVWVRKKDWTLLGDDLKLDYMEIYMKGKPVLYQPIAKWLGTGGLFSDNVYYTLSVNGLYY